MSATGGVTFRDRLLPMLRQAARDAVGESRRGLPRSRSRRVFSYLLAHSSRRRLGSRRRLLTWGHRDHMGAS